MSLSEEEIISTIYVCTLIGAADSRSFVSMFIRQNPIFPQICKISVIFSGLKFKNIVRRRQYVTAEVVDKEYCQAKKSENRCQSVRPFSFLTDVP